MLDRKRTRLKEFDYSSSNYYFVTICTKNKTDLFGDIIEETMNLNKLGESVRECWVSVENHFTNVEINEFIVMPNHFHAIVIIDGAVRLRLPQPDRKITKYSLSQIIAFFKYQSTKSINEFHQTTGVKIWQRSFYDRIIRNEKELYKIQNYIRYNAVKWEDDFGDENLEL